MNPLRPTALAAALAAAAVLGLSACSKNDTTASTATAPAPVVATTEPPPPSAPAPVAVAPAPAPAPVVVARNDDRRYEPHRVHELPPRADRDADVAPQPPRRVAEAPCPNCGVIDSYDAVQVQGKDTGTGAAVGGVGGAVLGSQIAGRGSHTLGGVLGAVGGGIIGNEVERHERKVTEYDVHVRMADGSMRTIRQASTPTVGEHVTVDNGVIHARG